MCSFYQNLHTALIFLTVILSTIASRNSKLKLASSGVDFLSPISNGIVFYVLLNNTSDVDVYEADLVPQKCCLETETIDKDCDSMELVGLHINAIPVASSVNVKLISPFISQFNRIGYCLVNLDSKNVKKRNKNMRDTFKIDFDTHLEKLDGKFKGEVNVEKRDVIVEDPLVNYKPVNCDIYYNGKKSFYNKKLRRCTPIPVCLPGHMNKDIIYNPWSNLCQNALRIDNEDMKLIQSLPETNVPKRSKVKQRSVFENTSYDPSLETEGTFLTWASTGNKNIAILGTIILLQFFALVFICCRYTKSCRNNKDQNNDRVNNVLYHYQQNASDTTPLIGVSNTDTTDYMNQSFPSNTPLPVKSYKSIQKEFNSDDVKKTSSDDALTKCLNRRTWMHAGVTTELEAANVIEDLVGKVTDRSSGSSNLHKPQFKISSESKVNFVNEVDQKRVMIYDNDDEYHDIEKGQESEEEIKCLSYSADKNSSKSSTKCVEVKSERSAVGKHHSSQKEHYTQDSAQINFSVDTIDEFLDKKGLYLAPNNLSQFSFPASKTGTNSSCSSLTMRSRMKAKWRELFPKPTRSGPKSEPVIAMPQKLELLHLSQMSIYSSSLNDSELEAGHTQ